MTYIDVRALKEREWDVVQRSYKDALDLVQEGRRRSRAASAVVPCGGSAAGVAVGLEARSTSSGQTTLWTAFVAAFAVSAIGILTVARVAYMQQTDTIQGRSPIRSRRLKAQDRAVVMPSMTIQQLTDGVSRERAAAPTVSGMPVTR